MKTGFFVSLLFISFILKAETLNPLQKSIDNLKPNEELLIPEGVYRGHLRIDKPVKLKAQGKVLIDGLNEGTVVQIQANGVLFQGFEIINSGESHTNSDAALEITGQNNQILNNQITNSFFGIKVKDSKNSEFKDNHVQSYRDKDVSDRGDGFFVWNSHDNIFENNHIEYVRDFSINNSFRNKVINNQILQSRTGFYLVFAEKTKIESNRVENCSTGIAALYSPNVQIKNNLFLHNLTGNASCISTKDSVGVEIMENKLIHCGVGYLSDAPMGESAIKIERNLFAHHFLAIRIYGQKGSHSFKENVFFENMDDMFLPLDGNYSSMTWESNYWDRYQGFGSQPFQDVIYSDRIWMEIPKAKFFSNSPFFEIIDFLERLAPFSSPTVQAEDKFPQSKQSEVFKRYKEVLKK